METPVFRLISKISLTVGFCALVLFSTNLFAGIPQVKENTFKPGKALSFKENKGQFIDKNKKQRPDILFVGQSGSTNIYLRKSGISYVFNKYPAMRSKFHFLKDSLKKISSEDKVQKGYRLDMEFVGANSDPEIIKEGAEQAYTDYYLPHCPDGITDINSYKRITYKDIYPGIDVVFYPGQNGLEYDFNIRPGGNPDKIKLQYHGADDVKISKEGNLSVLFQDGNITETTPKVYYNDNGLKKLIRADFNVSNINKVVSFRLAHYDTQTPVTIDPNVEWSTYLGGSGNDEFSVIAVDKDSNVYGVGITNSTDFPITPGAFQTSEADTFSYYNDLFICKFTAGGKLLWSTYYGGTGNDGNQVGFYTAYYEGPGIAVDSSDNVFIVSGTSSLDLPVTSGAYQTANPSGQFSACIAKFNTNGKRIWATYYGDKNNAVTGESIAVDAAQNIYITGTVSGPGNLKNSDTTYGQYGWPPANSSIEQVFIAKFNEGGSRIWSMKYGGNKTNNGFGSVYIQDLPTGLTVDDSNNVIVVGNSTSTNFPLTNVPKYYGTMDGDPFILKLDSAGTRKWAFLIGGSNAWMRTVTTDPYNNVYVSGYSNGFTAIKNPYQNNSSGYNQLAYIGKFDGGGNLLWGSFFGGTGFNNALGITVDGGQNVTICGATSSTDLPLRNPVQKKYGGGLGTGFITKFNKSGGLIWSTYYGGSGSDVPTDIKHDSKGNVYFCGYSSSRDYPTKKAYQDTTNYLEDGILTKLFDCANLYSNVKVTKTNLCIGDTVTLAADIGFDSYKWNTGDTTRIIKVYKTGSYSAQIASNGGCSGVSQVISLNFTSPPTSSIQASGPLNFCQGDSVTLKASGVYPHYLWTTGAAGNQIVIKKSGLYKLTTFNSGGCFVSDSVQVNVYPNPAPVIRTLGGFFFCGNNPIVLDAGPGYKSYYWNNGDTTQKVATNALDSFRVTVDSIGGCLGVSPWVHTQKVVAQILANRSTDLCKGDTVILDAGGGFVSYFWSDGETSREIKVAKSGIYSVIATQSGGCHDTSKPVTVVVHTRVSPVITGTNNFIICGNNPVVLDAGAGYSDYLWSNGETTQKIIVNATDSFQITVDSANSCSASSAWVYTKKYTAQILSNRSTRLCSGDTVLLDAGSGYKSYFWNNGDTTRQIEVWKAGVYYSIVTQPGGCLDTSNKVTVIVVPKAGPVISGNNNLTICGNTPVTLDAGSGYSGYLWSNGDTTSQIKVYNADSFRVKVDSASGCPATSPWVRVQKSVSQVMVNGSASACTGDTVVLDAGKGFVHYLWNDNETTEKINVWKSGNYNVIATTSSGCVDTSKPISVTIYPVPPKPVITQSGSELVSTTSNQYQWFKKSKPLLGENYQQLTQITGGYYSVETTDSNGCVAYSDSFLVIPEYFNIYPNPTVGILHIAAGLGQSVDISYSLTDMISQTIFDFDDGTHQGFYSKDLNLNLLANAMYILKVKVGNKIYTEKIVKISEVR